MNFSEMMLPTSMDYVFSEKDYFVWGASMFKHRNTYYMIYSRWKKEYGFQAWVTDSELCLAKSDEMLGRFEFVKVVLGNESRDKDDRMVYHNPTVIEKDGKFYLYHMRNHGNGDWWTHRNNQRVAVVYTADPEGEWKDGGVVIGVSDEGIDSLMTSNPSATVMPDGKVLMMYKAVSKEGELPKGGKVLCGMATADTPLGEFVKSRKPIMENPLNPWSVEDPFMWCQGRRYYALVKDFHGYFTHTDGTAWALFESDNGYDWDAAEKPLAYFPELDLGDRKVKVKYLDRPQIYMEDGKCKCLACACMIEDNGEVTFNIRIPLK